MKIYLAVSVILAASLAAWADAPWLANVKVSDDPGGYNQDEVCLTVWRSNVYAGFNDYRVPSVKAFFARSTNNGSSFLANVQMATDSATGAVVGDPALAVDDQGNLYYVLCDFSYNRVYVCRSTNNGVSFDPTRYVSPGLANIDKSWISTRGSNVFVTWDQPVTPPHDWFNKSTDRGQTWGTPVQVDHATSGSDRWGPVPRQALDGTIYVSWGWDTRSGIDTVNGIYCARSTNGGASFQTEVLVQTTRFGYASSNPRVFQLPPLDVSPISAGQLFMMFEDSRGQSSSDRYNLNVYSTRSTDGGVTWSPRVKVNDDSTTVNDTTQQFMPWLAVDYRGWLHSIWYDGRRFGGGSNRYDIFYTYSSNGGLTWSHNERVTDSSFVANGFYGDYIGIATDSNSVYASWTDGRNSSTAPDIYFSRRTLPSGVLEQAGGPPLPSELELSQNTPNPVKGGTNIAFALSRPGPVDLTVYDIMGREVRTLLREERKAGYGTATWDGRNQRGYLVLRESTSIASNRVLKCAPGRWSSLAEPLLTRVAFVPPSSAWDTIQPDSLDRIHP